MSFVENVHREHLERLQRLTNRVTVPRLRRLYHRAIGDMENDLQRSMHRMQGETFSAHHARMVAVQLRAGIARLGPQAVRELDQSSTIVRAQGLRGLVRDINRLEQHFSGTTPILPIDEASKFWGVVNGRGDSLLRRHQTAASNWSTEIIRSTEKDLASMTLRNITVREMGSQIAQRLGVEWWRGERIARTESSFAYSSVAADGIRSLHAVMPEIYMRWSEHVNDLTEAPMDDRVGFDSIAMHGQVAKPDGRFVMPSDERVGLTLWGLYFDHPPNRPNDRAVLSPWKIGWGVPGWIMRGGMKVNLTPDMVSLASPGFGPSPGVSVDFEVPQSSED